MAASAPPQTPLPEEVVDFFRSVATVQVPDRVRFDFAGPRLDLRLLAEFEH